MATFTNVATLTYNGGTTVSNTVTGELLEVLDLSKLSVVGDYAPGDQIPYVLTLRNTGPAALTGLTVTDDLGGYTQADGTTTLYPLTYVADTVRYYVNGVLQATPAVTAGPPLAITGITVPAGGDATIVYLAEVNAFAPLGTAGTVVNTATITGGGLTNPVTDDATITARTAAALAISKTLSPAVVAENGQLTYTFVIQNTGAAAATGDVVLTDTFNPILENISVSYNGTAWTQGTNYTYDEATGVFATLAGQITVPAATYTQNADGTYTTVPGTVTITVTGTV